MRHIDRHGQPKINVKQCTSATCQGSETGCSNGDCILSGHHSRTSKWVYWTINHYYTIFGRYPHGYSPTHFPFFKP
jgi:hypothetical protein